MRFILLFFITQLFIYSQSNFTQTGKASYYADRFHGNKTKSGEKYDMNAYTAAHRTLPLQTKVKVTNQKNNKSVIVRINDIGPFSHGRIIDVSKAAAKELGMIEDGVANVSLEVVDTTQVDKDKDKKESNVPTSTTKPNKHQPVSESKDSIEISKTTDKDKIIIEKENKKPESKTLPSKETMEVISTDSSPIKVDLKEASSDTFKPGNFYTVHGVITNPKGYGVQVGSFSHIFNALKLCRELTEQGFTKLIILSEKETNQFYKVYIGEFSQEEETSPIQLKLREKNKDYLVKKYP